MDNHNDPDGPLKHQIDDEIKLLPRAGNFEVRFAMIHYGRSEVLSGTNSVDHEE